VEAPWFINSSLSEQHITCTFAQVAPLSQKLVKQAVENYVKQLIKENPSLLDEKEEQESQEQEGQEQGGQEGMGGQGGGQEEKQGNENKPDERKVGVEELAEHISENILAVPEEIKSEIKEIEKLEFQYEQVHANKGGDEMRILVPRKMYNDYIHIYI